MVTSCNFIILLLLTPGEQWQSPRHCKGSVELASENSESPATVAQKLMKQQPETRLAGLESPAPLRLHFAQGYNVSVIVLFSAFSTVFF
jgi:hypothetical protein